MDPSLGFLVNDALKLKVKIKVEPVMARLGKQKLKADVAMVRRRPLIQVATSLPPHKRLRLPASAWQVPIPLKSSAVERAFGRISYAGLLKRT